jgi:NAD(P)-dependent dehydrogenase (short-subunit alcohol dehydrogenase family)
MAAECAGDVVVKALLFGASGGLAAALGRRMFTEGWRVDLVTRAPRRQSVELSFAASLASGQAHLFICQDRYSEFEVSENYDVIFFSQALFAPSPLIDMRAFTIGEEIEVGLTEPIRLTRQILARFSAKSGVRRDFCYIGSTSAYEGFRNTSVYCAVKHGLLGFVRAMNQEYGPTDTRFWLFSMGTMNTDMGAKVLGQDSTSYLAPEDVATRIVSAVSNRSNVFEPEVIMRRRTVR